MNTGKAHILSLLMSGGAWQWCESQHLITDLTPQNYANTPLSHDEANFSGYIARAPGSPGYTIPKNIDSKAIAMVCPVDFSHSGGEVANNITGWYGRSSASDGMAQGFFDPAIDFSELGDRIDVQCFVDFDAKS